MKAVARLWATHPVFDSATQAEAARILEDPEALSACFGRELQFGTGGLRGPMGVGTNRMNVYTVARATQGLAQYLLAQGGRRVAVAYDTRLCSEQFARVTAGVLAKNRIEAWVYGVQTPTPMLSFGIRDLGLDAGVMITASHNPAQDNGYKVYNRSGEQITDQAAAEMAQAMSGVTYTKLSWLPEGEARRFGMWRDIPEAVSARYIQATLACRAPGAEGRRSPLRILYTPLNGAALGPVCRVLGALDWVEVVPVEPQWLPDGNFPTCPIPNPERREAFALGMAQGAGQGMPVILATDPDGDRAGVAVAEAGAYRLLTGNEVGLLLLEHWLRRSKEAGCLPSRPVVMKTLVSSDLGHEIAQEYGAEMIEVLTGFKYIGEQIGRMERSGRLGDFVFAFEESLGYLSGTHIRDKDGVLAILNIVDMLADYQALGMGLPEALDALYKRYGYIAEEAISIHISGAFFRERIQRGMAYLRRDPPAFLGGEAITECRDYGPGILGLPPTDMLLYKTRAGSRAILRPSGTEPKWKAYISAKGKSPEAARHVAQMAAGQARAWMEGALKET